MSTAEEAYRCDACRTWHDDYDAANECCPVSIAEGWKCAACGKYHRLEQAARDCCHHECPQCRTAHDSIDEAEACCGSTLTHATPKELEAHGQQRLPV